MSISVKDNLFDMLDHISRIIIIEEPNANDVILVDYAGRPMVYIESISYLILEEVSGRIMKKYNNKAMWEARGGSSFSSSFHAF